MGSPPGPSRLLSLHAARSRILAGQGGLRSHLCPARRRLFSLAREAPLQRAAILSRPLVLCGRGLPCSAGADSSLVRLARPRAELYTGIYMHCSKALLILLASTAGAADFSGASALEFTRQAVAFGPRPPGSAANHKLQAYIEAQLKKLRCQISFDAFTADTPAGPVAMRNIIARFPGTTSRAIVITGHFDTKPMPGRGFVGANDGGSSTGFLLEL